MAEQTKTLSEKKDWSSTYPALDGIAKEARTVPMFPSSYYDPQTWDGDFDETYPAQESIRADLQKILDLPSDEFFGWYHERKDAAQRLLSDYKLTGSIPDLSEGSKGYTTTISYNVFDIPIKQLERGLDYLERIKDRHMELSGKVPDIELSKQVPANDSEEE